MMNIKICILFILLPLFAVPAFANQNGMMSTFGDTSFSGLNGVMETKFLEQSSNLEEFNGIRTEIEPQNKAFANGLNGIMDVLDPHTDSTIGEKIINKQVDAPPIQFQLLYSINEYSIANQNLNSLKKYLDIIKNENVKSLIISGHTDPTGSISYNQKLSEQRAQAVANWLMNNGVNAQKVQTIGSGIDHDAEDFNQARRVDILIIVK